MTSRQRTDRPIRLAIAGVGNCASSLVQGIEYYRDADPTDDERAFNVKLAFCRFCDPGTRLQLLQRRRDALATRLADGRPGTIADRYLRALAEHDPESVERDIAWLDRLITEETS